MLSSRTVTSSVSSRSFQKSLYSLTASPNLQFCISAREWSCFQTICALSCSSHSPSWKEKERAHRHSRGYLLLQLKPKRFRCWFIWSGCYVHVECKEKAGVWNRENFVLFPTSHLFTTKINSVGQENILSSILALMYRLSFLFYFPQL